MQPSLAALPATSRISAALIAASVGAVPDVATGATSTTPRPLGYWLQHHPPGWISSQAAHEVDPVAQAKEVHELAVAFLRWLKLPRAERWDTFPLQVLSAALFNRYRLDSASEHPGASPYLDLTELAWPVQSERVRAHLSELRELLGPPLAVYKAVRSALPREAFPTADELAVAERTIESAADNVEDLVTQLESALREFATQSSEPKNVL